MLVGIRLQLRFRLSTPGGLARSAVVVLVGRRGVAAGARLGGVVHGLCAGHVCLRRWDVGELESDNGDI